MPPNLPANLTNLAKTFSDLATWKFLEEFGNLEMAFDNYRITIQITISELSHMSPKTISCER